MLRLAIKGLLHYWRLSLCLGAAVFLASAVLTGSLLVGDSVKQTLRNSGMERVGEVEAALVAGDRFFTQELAARVREKLSRATVAPALFVPGTATMDGGKVRLNGIWIYGVDEQFWELAGIAAADRPSGEFLAVGQPLAERIGLESGERLTVRMELPGRVSRDAPLSGETEKTATLSREVGGIIPAERLGRFSLLAEQTPAMNVFVPLADLQDALNKPGWANLLLSGQLPGFAEAVGEGWGLADAELRIRDVGDSGEELVSERVFVSDAVSEAVAHIDSEADGVLSYLINAYRAGEASVPYSVGTGIGPRGAARLGVDVPGDDQIVINSWLAKPQEDGGLGVKVGDKVSIEFFEVGNSREFVVRGDGLDESGAADASDLIEFEVAAVVPEESPALGEGWVPYFPGLETAESLRGWESGMPLDTGKIHGPDEEYWEKYKATPKAFFSLATAQRLWGNRFGQVSAINLGKAMSGEGDLEAKLTAQLALSDLGMAFREPVAEAEAAVEGALDFGALFGGLSGFLIVSALLLVALLSVFGMEARAQQIGALGAMGFTRSQVRRLFMWEGGLVAAVGAVLGVFGGVAYTRSALWALGGVWQGASAGLTFVYHARPTSLVIGALATLIAAKLALWLAGRRITAITPRELLAGELDDGEGTGARRRKKAGWVCIAGLAGGVIAVIVGRDLEGEKLAGAFFGAGFALLVSGLAAFAIFLRRAPDRGVKIGLAGLGRRNALRRRGRSMAVAAMVAAGVFLVVAVNAFRLNTEVDPTRRDSGTGGFAYIGNTTLPIYEDLNDPEVRDKFGLEDYSMDQLEFVPLRVRRGGEEASCLNLNQAARPRVVAVDPDALANRGAFRFAAVWKGCAKTDSPWQLLASPSSKDGPIPVIGDKASVMWALKKKLGDTISYPDGKGGEIVMRIVGLLENSVLQGNLVMAEPAFKASFPDAGGYEMFLVDAAADQELIGEVTKALEKRGAAFELASSRLEAYAQVQNTYISIFTVLGGLGVLLGTVGVGLVIARNVLDRRAELGLMTAVGFRRNSLVRMVLSEHVMLVVAGIATGTIAALVAVAPNLWGRAAEFPTLLITGIVGAIALAGLLFCVAAARMALRGRLLDAVRSE